MARLAEQVDRHHVAEKLYLHALGQFPTQRDALTGLALLKIESLGDIDGGEELLRFVLTAWPSDAITMLNLSRFLLEHRGPEAHEEARNLLERIMQLFKKDTQYFRYAEGLMKKAKGTSSGRDDLTDDLMLPPSDAKDAQLPD